MMSHKDKVNAVAAAVAASLGWCALAIADNTPTAHSDGVGAAISDTAITAKVKASFVGDDRLKDTHIKVKTTNGVVTLTGSAPNADSKAAAEDIAGNVSGVKSVDDNVVTPAGNNKAGRTVAKAERVGSDSWITTKVKSELLSDSVTKGADVHVKTKNGVVMLRGSLPNEDASDHVKDLAKQVEGVKSVDTSELTVKPE